MMYVAAMTNTGKIRTTNEDCAAVDDHFIKDGSPVRFELDAGKHLLLVADGMGGHAGGEVASSMTVRYLIEHRSRIGELPGLMETIRRANRHIYDSMEADERLRGMGTTLAGCIINDGHLLWFNVGDSRVYRFRRELQQLTSDHVPETTRRSTRSHSITESVGGRFTSTEVFPAAGECSVRLGDKLLICTDGLTDLVADPEIGRVLGRREDVSADVSHLVQLANEHGGHDNVTVIVAQL